MYNIPPIKPPQYKYEKYVFMMKTRDEDFYVSQLDYPIVMRIIHVVNMSVICF